MRWIRPLSGNSHKHILFTQLDLSNVHVRRKKIEQGTHGKLWGVVYVCCWMHVQVPSSLVTGGCTECATCCLGWVIFKGTAGVAEDFLSSLIAKPRCPGTQVLERVTGQTSQWEMTHGRSKVLGVQDREMQLTWLKLSALQNMPYWFSKFNCSLQTLISCVMRKRFNEWWVNSANEQKGRGIALNECTWLNALAPKNIRSFLGAFDIFQLEMSRLKLSAK